MLGGEATVHLNELGAISVTAVQSGVQGGHQGALARPEDGVYARATVQQQLAGVQVTVKGRDVERCLAILGGHVQETRSFFYQPLDQLQATGSHGFVSDSRAPDRPGVKGTTVLG